MLVCVWASIIGFDSSCRVELARDKSQNYFMQYLAGAEHPPPQRCMAAFVLAELCNNYREGQQAALQQGLQRSCTAILSQPEVIQAPLLKRWTCLCLYKSCEDFGWSKYVCLTENSHIALYPLLEDPDPTVRATAVLTMGEMFGASDPGNQADGVTAGFSAGSEAMGGLAQQQALRESEQELATQILESCTDGSVIVRKEALISLSKFMSLPAHASCLSLVAIEMLRINGKKQENTFHTNDLNGNFNDKCPWILSAKDTTDITDTVAKHLSNEDLFGAIGHEDADPQQQRSGSKGADSSPRRRMSPRSSSESSGGPEDGDFPDEGSAEIKDAENLHMEENETTARAKSLPRKSRNALMAAGYVGLWLALFEVHGKDPHPEIRDTAAALIQWLHNSLPGSSKDKSLGNSGHGGGPHNPNMATPPRKFAQRGGGPGSSPRNAPPLSPLGIASNMRSHSPNQQGSMSPERFSNLTMGDAFDPSQHNASPITQRVPTPDEFFGALPLEPPSDPHLVSHLYDSLRTMFLTPDGGYDAFTDPMSVEGGERLYREGMLRELVALEARLREQGQELMASSNNVDPYYPEGVSISPDAALEGTTKGSALKNTKFEQRAILNIENAEITSHVLFHTFLDILAVSDGKNVGIWNLQNGTRVMEIHQPTQPHHVLSRTYTNRQQARNDREYLDKFSQSPRITAMNWINESHDALMMLGADNGTVTLWRDTSVVVPPAYEEFNPAVNRGYRDGDTVQEGTSLASAFFALPDVAETSRGSGVVLSWQQSSGTLVVGGNSNTLRLWDLGREQCVRVFSTGLDTCTTALASRTVSTGGMSSEPSTAEERNLSWTFAGFADGSIGVFDERVHGSGRVASAREHSAWIVGAQFRPDIPQIITGSVRGSVKFWDLRTMRSVKTLEVHKSPLTALAVHNCAPIMATGSHAQFIKVLTLGGDQLVGIIKYHDGFLGQRIGPVSCLAFHPVRMMLATGATDSIVSIYQTADRKDY